jgi:hypothetical protein
MGDDTRMTDNSSDIGTLELLARHLASAIIPLKTAVSDLASFRSYMYRLGWNVTSLPQSYIDLGNLVDEVTKVLANLPDSPSISDVQHVFDTVKRLYVAVKEINEAPEGVDATLFMSEIAKRMFESLIVDYISNNVPRLYTFLLALGIIQVEYHEDTNTRPSFVRSTIRTDLLASLISDPTSVLKLLYSWGIDSFDFQMLAEYLQEFCISLDIPASIKKVSKKLGEGYQDTEQTVETIESMVTIPFFDMEIEGIPMEVGIAVLELPAEGDKLPGVIIQPMIPILDDEHKISDDLILRIEPGTDLSKVFGILVRPNNISIRYPFLKDSIPTESILGIALEYKPSRPKIIFGSPESSRLQIKGGTAILNAKFGSKNLFRLEFSTRELSIVLRFKGEDGLLKRLFGGEDVIIPIPLSIEWSTTSGLRFKGGSGFTVSLNPHLKIGGANIDKLTLQLLSGDRIDPEPNFATEILLAISGSIGPVSFSMDGIGLQLKTVFKDGNAGPFDISVDIVLPQGVGLAIDGNGVKGGGFISRKDNQYSGIVDLNLAGFGVQALVIVKTEPSTSLLFAIFSQFRTPIQLGAGWKITKIGGLLGINHTVSHDSITAGIKSGILDRIIFPDDIIKNAPSVIASFETVFPVLHGQNIFGPAIQIAYGTPTLIAANVAVILEFPNPFLVSVLGKVTSKLPNQDHPIIQINIGIVGALDIVKGKAEAYGSLYDSKILSYPLSGDMAMAVSWMSEKNFIFSIGGFNPRFNPPSNFPPFNAPPLKRLNLAFSTNVTFECYLALTSNTLQIGARVDALFNASGVEISGFIGFDALVQFNPLYYAIDVAAGFSVKFKGRSLASIAFLGFIEGPNPHRIKGSVTFSILWWDISRDVDKTFGDKKPEIIVSVDPWPILRDALEQNDSWTAELPTWELVGVVTRDSSLLVQQGTQIIHPLGRLKVSQTIVPLNHTVTKFGSSDPENNFRFEIASLNNLDQSRLVSTKDYFAPAQFTEYDDSEKLGLNSYEVMDSGAFYTSEEKDIQFSFESASFKEIEYETYLLENLANKEDVKKTKIENLFPLNTMLSQTLILAGASYHNSVSNSNRLKYQLKLTDGTSESTLVDEKFIIVDEHKNVRVPVIEGEFTQSVAINKLADHMKANPQDKRNLIVISLFELRGELQA